MTTSFKVEFYDKEIIANLEKEGRKRMSEVVNEVRNVTIETLSGGRSGRQYRIPGTQKYYTASSPGEPPAVATAELRQSVSTEVVGDGRNTVGMVGTDKNYGKMLEYGTSKMAARPWLFKSFQKASDKIKSILSRKYIEGMK